MTKMTYVAALSTAIAILSADPAQAEVVAKLTALKEQTEKRNAADRKPTKAQVANAALQEQVLAVLTKDPATVTEIMARDEALAALSNQKVSALVNALVKDGRALKVPDGRKSTFCLA